MILGINKEEGDRMLTDFLVDFCKKNGTKECAEEAYKIMEDFQDSQLLITFLLNASIRGGGQIPEDIADFETKIISALATIFNSCDKEDVPNQFGDLFFGSEEEVMDKIIYDKKIKYATQQFVTAFYTFRDFESRNPEITKML